jgi:hypothetical protein
VPEYRRVHTDGFEAVISDLGIGWDVRLIARSSNLLGMEEHLTPTREAAQTLADETLQKAGHHCGLGCGAWLQTQP